jgi:hypothetical protein
VAPPAWQQRGAFPAPPEYLRTGLVTGAGLSAISLLTVTSPGWIIAVLLVPAGVGGFFEFVKLRATMPMRYRCCVMALDLQRRDQAGFRTRLWVPRTSSSSRDQAIFVDQATGANLPSDVVLLKIDRFG